MKRIIPIALIIYVMVFPSYAQILEIPDTAFLYALIDEGVDTNGDSMISYREAETVNTLWTGSKGITDMTGIEAFISLDTLMCENNQLTTLDVSNNTTLVALHCAGNQLTSLNVSNNTELTYLECWSNDITSIDLSNNKSLKSFRSSFNQLTTLDVSKNTELVVLSCLDNNLKHLNLTNNSELQILWAGGNSLMSLDISNNRRLASHESELDSAALWFLAWTSGPRMVLRDMPSLSEVCVWTTPFPPPGVSVDISGSPNVYFTTECSGETANENYQHRGLSIYPNPINSILTIETDQTDHYYIEISSLNGQSVFHKEMEGSNHRLDLSSFQKGVYFITIRSKDFLTTRKIVKL